MRSVVSSGLALWVLVGCSSSRFSAGLGAYTPALLEVSGDETGAPGILAPLSYPVGVKARFGTGTSLIAAIDYTPLARSSPESQIKNTYLIARALFGYEPSRDSIFSFAAGLAGIVHKQQGSGVFVDLNNGASTTSFATPSYSSTHTTLAPELELDLRYGPWLLATEVYWQGFLAKSKWSFGALMSLQYTFGGKK